MADGKRMSAYTPLSELGEAEQTTYLGNAAVTTFGKTTLAGDNINVNIPLSTLVPSVPVTDVTVNGSSVVSNGVAAVTVPTVPTAAGLAGDGLTANAGKLVVSNKVPAPTATTDRGKVLSVATDSDNIVWSTPAVTAISPKNGAITVINTANDVASGGYFFDVNTDASLSTVDVSVDNTTVRKLKVANPVPPTTNASDGNVLTYKDSDGIVWAAPQGGGGSDPFADIGEWDDGKTPPTKVKDYTEFPLENKGFYISVKKENDIIKHRFFFQYGGSGSNFYGPWAS